MKTALIDTGAGITAIDPKVIAALRPLQLGTVDVTRPGGSVLWVRSYDIRLAFEPDPQQARWWQHGLWFDVEAIGTPPASAGVDVLVGRDLLQKLVMSWDGPRGRSLLMY